MIVKFVVRNTGDRYLDGSTIYKIVPLDPDYSEFERLAPSEMLYSAMKRIQIKLKDGGHDVIFEFEID